MVVPERLGDLIKWNDIWTPFRCIMNRIVSIFICRHEQEYRAIFLCCFVKLFQLSTHGNSQRYMCRGWISFGWQLSDISELIRHCGLALQLSAPTSYVNPWTLSVPFRCALICLRQTCTLHAMHMFNQTEDYSRAKRQRKKYFVCLNVCVGCVCRSLKSHKRVEATIRLRITCTNVNERECVDNED